MAVHSPAVFLMSVPARKRRDATPPEGFPGHVRGWCVKAGEGTMQQGYRDVGYLFAPHIRRFKPSTIPNWSWRHRVHELAKPAGAGNATDVEQWFRVNYPQLMELIPHGGHRDFAIGVIERVAEIAKSCGE